MSLCKAHKQFIINWVGNELIMNELMEGTWQELEKNRELIEGTYGRNLQGIGQTF